MSVLQSIYEVLIRTRTEEAALDSIKKKTDALLKGVTIPVTLGAAGAGFDTAAAKIVTTTKSVTALKAELKKLETDFNVATTSDKIESLGGKIAGVKAELKTLADQQKTKPPFDPKQPTDFGNAVEKVNGKSSALIKTLAGFAIGAVFAGGLAGAVSAGKDFEQGIANLRALTGVTGAALNKMGDDARAAALKFGGTATDNINVYKGILSRLGPDVAKTPAVLNQISDAVQTLSKASGDDAVTSMDAVTTAILQFGKEAGTFKTQGDAATNFINVMAAGAKEGAAEIPAISAALKVAGTQASDSNVSFIETNAALQALAQGGKEGAEGGTALRNVLAELSKGRFLPAEVQSELKRAGVDVNVLADKSLSLTDRLRELSKISEDSALKTKLFGVENTAAGSILLRSIGFQEDLQKKITGTNVATEQAAINQATFAGELDRLKAVGADVGISLFKAVQPVLSFLVSGAKAFATFFGGVINFASQSKPLLIGLGTALAVVGGLLAVAAVKSYFGSFVTGTLQAALGIVQKLVPSLVTQTVATGGATTAQLGLNLAMLASPWGLAIAGIAALGVGVAFYMSNQKTLKDSTEDLNKELESFNAENEKAKSIEDTATKTRKLADEYDRLKKANLPGDQKKLAEVTKELDTATLGVASRVDEYGNAVEISTGKVRDFANEQDNLARSMRTTALADLNDKTIDLGSKITEATAKQKKLRDELNSGEAGSLTILQRIGNVFDRSADAGEQQKKNEAAQRSLLVQTNEERNAGLDAEAKTLFAVERQSASVLSLQDIQKKANVDRGNAIQIEERLNTLRAEGTTAVKNTTGEIPPIKDKIIKKEEDLLALAKQAAEEATKTVEIETRLDRLKTGQKFTTQDELNIAQLALKNLGDQIDQKKLLSNTKYKAKAELVLADAQIKVLEIQAKIKVDFDKLKEEILSRKDDIFSKEIEVGIRPKSDIAALLNTQIKRAEDELAVIDLKLTVDDKGNFTGVLDEANAEVVKKHEDLKLRLVGLNGQLVKNEEDTQAQIRELRIGNILDDTARSLAALEEKHNRELKDAGILGKADADLDKSQRAIKKELNERYERERIALAKQTAEKILSDDLQLRRAFGDAAQVFADKLTQSKKTASKDEQDEQRDQFASEEKGLKDSLAKRDISQQQFDRKLRILNEKRNKFEADNNDAFLHRFGEGLTSALATAVDSYGKYFTDLFNKYLLDAIIAQEVEAAKTSAVAAGVAARNALSASEAAGQGELAKASGIAGATQSAASAIASLPFPLNIAAAIAAPIAFAKILSGITGLISGSLGFAKGGIGFVGEKGPEIVSPISDFSNLMGMVARQTAEQVQQAQRTRGRDRRAENVNVRLGGQATTKGRTIVHTIEREALARNTEGFGQDNTITFTASTAAH